MTSREQFEAWATRVYGKNFLQRNPENGSYHLIQDDWEVWKASREAVEAVLLETLRRHIGE